MSSARDRVGVFGGTFDPIHVGHVAAARAALECAGLDRVLFVPTGQPPHRPAAAASAADRLEMTLLATSDQEQFAVSDVELRRAGASFTSDTLHELRELHPQADLFLILGWDAARMFQSWHEPDEVRSLAQVVVMARPGSGSPAPADLHAAGLGGEHVIVCTTSTPDISASSIRRDIRNGRPITGKVSSAVERYITARHLYS